eukprot:COSAG03_NODE_8641_length_784_cov_1.143066_1_plen_46_part_10
MDGKTRIIQLDTATNICSTGNFKPTDIRAVSAVHAAVADRTANQND